MDLLTITTSVVSTARSHLSDEGLSALATGQRVDGALLYLIVSATTGYPLEEMSKA